MNEIKRGALNAIGAAFVAVALYYIAQAIFKHEGSGQATMAGVAGRTC